MNEKALRILEYDKIINMLAGFAVSPMAKEMAHHLQPSVSMSEIVLRQQETTEAVSMVLRKGALPSAAFGKSVPS